MMTFIFGAVFGAFMVTKGIKIISKCIDRYKRRNNIWYQLEQDYLRSKAQETNNTEVVANN